MRESARVCPCLLPCTQSALRLKTKVWLFYILYSSSVVLGGESSFAETKSLLFLFWLLSLYKSFLSLKENFGESLWMGQLDHREKNTIATLFQFLWHSFTRKIVKIKQPSLTVKSAKIFRYSRVFGGDHFLWRDISCSVGGTCCVAQKLLPLSFNGPRTGLKATPWLVHDQFKKMSLKETIASELDQKISEWLL